MKTIFEKDVKKLKILFYTEETFDSGNSYFFSGKLDGKAHRDLKNVKITLCKDADDYYAYVNGDKSKLMKVITRATINLLLDSFCMWVLIDDPNTSKTLKEL